ncbi:MAG: hypothetical protein MRY74_10940 [Neomegalonema sp.]|nr:hypothetical protein [Neomegalonema sp.]
MDLIPSPTDLDFSIFFGLNIILFVAAILVLLMQPGFMMLETGAVSRLNAINDIYKNLLDICFGAVAFWLVGWDILTGASPLTPLLSQIGLAAAEPAATATVIKPDPTINFLFQLGFATTAATICSGAVTGRIRPHVYLVFAGLFTGFFYPLIAFTVWHPLGLLYGVFYDFAGSIVVHASGAAAGLAGTLLLRPRLAYNGYDPIGLGREQLFRVAKRHAPHNLPLAALGVVFLWIGWFGFNGGTLFANGLASPALAGTDVLSTTVAEFGRIAAATILAPAAAALTATLIHLLTGEDRSLLDTMNALLAGAVAVTAGANRFDAVDALLVGVVAGAAYRVGVVVLERRSVDDPVNAIAVHGLPGLVGVVAAPLGAGVPSFQAALNQGAIGVGLFFVVFFSSLFMFALLNGLYALIRRVIGARDEEGPAPVAMRVPYRTEMLGIDAEVHGQDAYSFSAKE